jgi:sec-independent protein translocase protein TatC
VRLIPRRRQGSGLRRRNPEGAMTILEHLEELRKRLFWMIGAVTVAAVAGWFLFDRTVNLLLKPARPYLELTKGRLIFTGPLEAFTLHFKVAFVIGFCIALPIVLFHLWRFVSPGLHRNERRYAVPFIASGMVLFAGGVWFALVTLPQALRFLIGKSITGGVISPLLSAQAYIQFGLLYLVIFGLSFEFPVVLMLLTTTGVVSSRQMAKYRRHAFMGIAVVVAVATPTVDWFTMTVLTLALYVLYELSIWISRLMRR